MSAHNAVLNLILLFFRHFHIPTETVFPKGWKDSHSATNKKPTRYPYSRKKVPGNQSPGEIYRKYRAGKGPAQIWSYNIRRFIFGVSGRFVMTNKGAALIRYKHICSRDCSPLLASLTSPIHFDKGWRLFPRLSCAKCPTAYFFSSALEVRCLNTSIISQPGRIVGARMILHMLFRAVWDGCSMRLCTLVQTLPAFLCISEI